MAPAVLKLRVGRGVRRIAARSAYRQSTCIAPDTFCAFLFLLCGAIRLARFNVQVNPVPKNPGRAGRKYFVGMPIPAAAAMVASVVYAFVDEGPLPQWWVLSTAWLALLGLLSFLMVSTWRYPSFKDLSLVRPRSPLTYLPVIILLYLVWDLSQPMLLGMSICYVMSGIVIRAGGIVRRRFRTRAPPKIRATPGASSWLA